MEDKGKKIVRVCNDCLYIQPGWSGRDGDACQKCKGSTNPVGWWDVLMPRIEEQWLAYKKMNNFDAWGGLRVADKISEKSDDETFYLEVESNYKVPEEGKGQNDAVNFFMGKEHINALDSLISVSTEDARKFATSIIAICNRIDG
jgi:hypothetical protein